MRSPHREPTSTNGGTEPTAFAMLRSWSWLAFGGAGALALAVYALASSRVLETAVFSAAMLAAPVAVALGIWLHRPQFRRPWIATAAGLVPFGIGATIWATQGLIEGEAPFPSVADPVILLVYVPLATALVLVAARLRRGSGALIDTAIIAATLAVAAWVLLVERYLEAEEFPLSVRAVQIAYAALDVLLAAALARFLIGGAYRNVAYALTALGVALLLIADALWNWAALAGTYTVGTYSDLGWIGGVVALGVAALHPSMRTLGGSPALDDLSLGRVRVALLTVAGLGCPALLALDRDGVSNRELVLATSPIFALVVLRMAGAVRASERYRRELARHNEELRELDRLKDTFVASVSHELRTPLTSIRGYLELVRDGEAGEINAEQDRFLGIVDRNAERLLRLVSDLLFVSQVDAGKLGLQLTDVDLAELATEAVESASPAAAEKGVAMHVDAPPGTSVRGDSARLAQLLDNLVSNAVKFTPEGGRVDVRMRADGSRAVLEVADTGMGIARTEQPHVFDRFFRTSSAMEHAVSGTGLGLAIAKAIVDAHDGQIAVISEPGEGTTFRVELPISTAADSRLAAVQEVVAP